MNEDINKINILKIEENYEEPNNPIYKFDNELFDKKYKEYKNQIDKGNYIFNDTYMNIGLIAHRLMQDEEEKYRIAGKCIYDAMFGHLEEL